MTTHRRTVTVSLFVWFATNLATAQEPDIAGSKDHPMIKRYEGSRIWQYEVRHFDEVALPLGKAQGEKANPAHHDAIRTLGAHRTKAQRNT